MRHRRLPAPQVYKLQLGPRAQYQVALGGALRSGFHDPATRQCPKLYVVMQRHEIHYVGVTNQPMSSRINFGLKAKGKGGYHGYKWKNIRGPLKLIVYSFPDQNVAQFLLELETVEAELVFHVRKETRKWPISQTEIHFHQPTRAHLAAVQNVFALCKAG